MLTVDISALKPTQLSTLKPGTIFLHGRYPSQAVAVALERHGNSLLWLNLSGSEKFMLGANERGLTVYPLLSDPGRISLKIAPDSVADPKADYAPGHLLVDEEGPAIACRWDNDPNWDYRNVVPLSSWAQSKADVPRFRFSRWALGYMDAADQWNEIVQVAE